MHGPGTFFLFVYSTEEYNSSGTDHLVEGLGKKQMPACNGLDTTMRDMCGTHMELEISSYDDICAQVHMWLGAPKSPQS